ncbi:DUF6457 domain-containing protein [Arcanobacterium buesumense]|uniref:Molybdopterin-guanine dinucleotide biosynthesis protein n=1 Tax=Arcanobacterium buesumense TaxID=2722751 RepID=A0A6H2EM98_9ACTO|nr:DUF6457 domain-containing protein [Arcanobacterium buesumense]QJC22191.1 molybdopterin-guanine dinucleotide biosynthesis protein [Arcanobacterium buesumense]
MTRKDDPAKMAQMEAWLSAVNAELELDPQLIADHKKPLLQLISTVAHGPSRPGAPLTAFLVGYAAATTGANPDDLSLRLEELARNFPTAD